MSVNSKAVAGRTRSVCAAAIAVLLVINFFVSYGNAKPSASAEEPVLVAIERAGIKAPSRCRAGECGWCRSRLLEGTVFIPQENEMRRWADKHYGYIHPCCSFPTSDLTLEIPGEFF